MSQADLAGKAGVTYVTISRLEGGYFKGHPLTIQAILKALEVSQDELDWLMEDMAGG